MLTRLLLSAALLAVTAAPAAAWEIRYSRGTADVAVGPMAPDGEQGLTRGHLNEFKPTMGIVMPLQTISVIDSSGYVFARLASAGASLSALEQELRDIHEGRSKADPTGVFSYSWEEIEPVNGLVASLSYSWGGASGGTYGGTPSSTPSVSAWMLDARLAVPTAIVPGWLDALIGADFYWHNYTFEDLPATRNQNGGTDSTRYSGGYFGTPFFVKLEAYPVRWVSIGPFVGYDPIVGLVSLAVPTNGYPRQSYYYGAEANARLFSLIQLSAGYYMAHTNSDYSRSLDEGQTRFGAGVRF